MNLSKLRRALVAGLVGGVVASVALTVPAHAAPSVPTYPAGSYAPLYLIDGITLNSIPAGTVMPWDGGADGVVSSAIPFTGTPSNLEPYRLPVGNGGTGYISFISLPGGEMDRTKWQAYGTNGGAVGTGVLMDQLIPGNGFIGGAPGANALKASGGTFSMGVAYTSNNGLTVTTAFFTSITIEAGTGNWTFATPVTKTATTTSLTTSAATVAAGDSVTLTATVSDPTASGNVTFNEGSTLLGTSASAAGIATLTTTALAAGSHAITATYAGDAVFTGSTSSAVTVTVNGTTGPDSALLVAGNAGGVTAAPITGTVATLSVPATLNGKKVNVFGYSAPTFLAQVTISGGSLQVNVASFSAGTHQIAIVDAATGTILGWVQVTMPRRPLPAICRPSSPRPSTARSPSLVPTTRRRPSSATRRSTRSPASRSRPARSARSRSRTIVPSARRAGP
jgi:hypothetical protein